VRNEIAGIISKLEVLESRVEVWAEEADANGQYKRADKLNTELDYIR
jgi:hypothetical protein